MPLGSPFPKKGTEQALSPEYLLVLKSFPGVIFTQQDEEDTAPAGWQAGIPFYFLHAFITFFPGTTRARPEALDPHIQPPLHLHGQAASKPRTLLSPGATVLPTAPNSEL